MSLLYASTGTDSQGANYHALFQFQLMGLCGAFLTGDLFNLFVFFEVLLIASYGLLLHGGGRDRVKAGLHYVVFNLVGSSLFLIGVGTIYAVTGTLNMADLAVKVAQVPVADAPLLASGGLLLLVVFAIKAALLPLCFWLPRTYGSATAPVAALFAIMTKVGVYGILRVYTLIFGAEAGAVANLATPWLLPLALLTLAVATVGALASRRLPTLVSYLVIASVGTMLTAIALGTEASIAAAVYYLVHSTLVIAALFLLIDLIACQRGSAEGLLERSNPVGQPGLLGTLFIVAAVAAAGLPPLSGFIGKALILGGALGGEYAGVVYAVILVSGLFTIIALARAGSMVFWNVTEPAEHPVHAVRSRVLAVVALLAMIVGLAFFAGPVVDYSTAIARQMLDPADYLHAVLVPDDAVPAAGDHSGGGQ